MTNKFVNVTKKNELLEYFSECLLPFKISKSIINKNLDHALHQFHLEMKKDFSSFIETSPQDMRYIFYQILIKHFLISINSDKHVLEHDELEQITNKIEHMLD
ncbi:MAG: hypothetical protein JW776_00495 [Candidatus Lokiarchaeota archaeon]|nr:hypothetical protein [Candidatus Lokiarchaeota archaeon]